MVSNCFAWCGGSNYQVIFLLVKSNIFKQEMISVFHTSTMILSLLLSYLITSIWVISNYLHMVNPIVKLFLLLVEGKIFKQLIVSIFHTWTIYYHCCKVTWKSVSGVWEHMNYCKKVFSNCVDVLNPNIKSFLLLVKWKIIRHKIVSVYVSWTIIVSQL